MRWSWRGAVALVLATTLGVAFASTLIIAALHPGSMSSAGGDLMHTLGAVLAGSLATWLGGARLHDESKRLPDDRDDEDGADDRERDDKRG